jgi:hypothetical protein
MNYAVTAARILEEDESKDELTFAQTIVVSFMYASTE